MRLKPDEPAGSADYPLPKKLGWSSSSRWAPRITSTLREAVHWIRLKRLSPAGMHRLLGRGLKPKWFLRCALRRCATIRRWPRNVAYGPRRRSDQRLRRRVVVLIPHSRIFAGAGGSRHGLVEPRVTVLLFLHAWPRRSTSTAMGCIHVGDGRGGRR